MNENQLAKIVFETGLKIHKTLGAGLPKASYLECLEYELNQEGLKVEKEKKLSLIYEELELDAAYSIDLLVEDKLVILIKSAKQFENEDISQMLALLDRSSCKLGLLITFNVNKFKNGIKRIINGELEE